MSPKRSISRREMLKCMGVGVAGVSMTAKGTLLSRPEVNIVPCAQSDNVLGPTRINYIHYTFNSENQAYGNPLRILEPDGLDAIDEPAILYVLPVNPDVTDRWNDGFVVASGLDLHNKYGFVVVAPAFSNWPWYADHPEDPMLQQETYFVQEIVPFVDSLYPRATKRLLLGFSKSGNGSYTLLLRYPDLFHAASIWDAPLMKMAPDQFEMPDIYGTQDNFDNYCIPKLLEEKADLFRDKPPRLALFGYGFFGGENPPEWSDQHTEQAHALMESLSIPHIYDSSTQREHRWDSGWMEQAAAAIDEMAHS